jgi:hypothetical protein
MDQAYTDKLDGKIPEEFWQRKSADWRAEELCIEGLLAAFNQVKKSDRLPDAKRILELANRAYFLFIAKRVKYEEWSALEDDFRTVLFGTECFELEISAR